MFLPRNGTAIAGRVKAGKFDALRTSSPVAIPDGGVIVTLNWFALADYQSDLTVEQLDRDDTVLKTYIFRSAWPIGLGAIDLSADGADAIETFDCTRRYQHFEASSVNF